MPDLPVEVEEVRVLRLQPGDIIVAKARDSINVEEAAAIKDALQPFFPDHEVILLSGIDLEVARSDQFDGSGGRS